MFLFFVFCFLFFVFVFVFVFCFLFLFFVFCFLFFVCFVFCFLVVLWRKKKKEVQFSFQPKNKKKKTTITNNNNQKKKNYQHETITTTRSGYGNSWHTTATATKAYAKRAKIHSSPISNSGFGSLLKKHSHQQTSRYNSSQEASEGAHYLTGHFQSSSEASTRSDNNFFFNKTVQQSSVNSSPSTIWRGPSKDHLFLFEEDAFVSMKIPPFRWIVLSFLIFSCFVVFANGNWFTDFFNPQLSHAPHFMLSKLYLVTDRIGLTPATGEIVCFGDVNNDR